MKASNLFGRILSAAVADHLGVAPNFLVFACLNVAGAALVHAGLERTRPMVTEGAAGPALDAWRHHLAKPELRASFGIGFLILFAFIGTFTYVNFVLVRGPHSLGMMGLGLVYLVFLPALLTTPLAGALSRRFGARRTIVGALAVAAAGLPPLLLPHLPTVLVGLVLVAVGTFLAQAVATGFVGRAAESDRAAACRLYLASYFLGGVVRSAVLGQVLDRSGWGACVAGIAAALFLAALLASRLRAPAGTASTPAIAHMAKPP